MAGASTDEDNETFWADNKDMMKKAKAYEKRAKSVVQKGIFWGSKSHPWEDDAYHGPWRLRIFELAGDHSDLPNGPRQFENARDLLTYWESTPNDGTAEKRNRRLIVLESLDARIAELLGVLLDIPPEFFLAHCDETLQLSIMNKQLFKQGSSTYWKVFVPQKRSLPQVFQESPEHRRAARISCGAFRRPKRMVAKGDDHFSFHGLVSCWAKTHAVGSWTTVILTDPHLARISYYPTPDSLSVIDLEDFKPRRKTPYEVILDSEEGEFAEPHERSIFDTIVKIHNDSSPKVTSDPFSATCFARNCIRAIWERQVCENNWEVSDIVNDDGRFHLIRQSENAFEDFEKKMAADNQNVETYQKLMQKRYMINSHRRHIRTITEKFRLRDTDYLSTGTPELQDTLKEEAKLWMSLEARLQDMEEVICDHMKMYSARSAMEETYEAKMQSWESMRQTEEANRQTAAANRMARSSGQLTKIATIVVPCTFVASIFSMGGDFAAGESLFYVYWIISVPITLGLFYWVVHDDISDTVQKSKEWMSWKRANWNRKALSEVSIV